MFKPLPANHVRPKDLAKTRARYGVKQTYFILSGVFGGLTITTLPIFINLTMTGELDRQDRMWSYALLLIAALAIFSLSLRLRASYCVICNQFNKPTPVDWNGYCAACGAHLFKFDAYQSQDIEAGQSRDELILEMAKRGDANAVQTLLNKGIDINFTDKFGHSALMIAASAGHDKMVELLIAWGADISKTNSFGLNALMLAADKGKTESAEILLKHGIGVNDKTKDGRSVFDIAKKQDNPDLMNLLEKHS